MFIPQFWGWMALIALYIISIISAFKEHGKYAFLPWVAALGHNKKLSTSQLQFLIWTGVTVFAYCTAFANRVNNSLGEALQHLPEIPINLLLLMGLSVATTATSKGITISYIDQGQLDANKDDSNALTNRDGQTSLVKIQMLIWTLISATIYLITFNHWLKGSPEGFALPDIDGALLVLMGVAQGGYIGGKLTSKSVGKPIIESLIPKTLKVGESVKIIGLRFGAKEQGQIICQDASAKEDLMILDATSWSEEIIEFIVPENLKPGDDETSKKFKIKVRASGLSSDEKDLEIVKDTEE